MQRVIDQYYKHTWIHLWLISIYFFVGILPFWYRIWIHFIEIFIARNKELGEYLAVDFSWYEIHNTPWLQIPLFLLALTSLIWVARGNIWRQMFLGGIFLIFAVPPVFLVTVQNVYRPKYELSSCSEYPLYVQPGAFERRGGVYTIQEGSLKHAGEASWCKGDSCNLDLYKERVQQQTSLSIQEAKACVKDKHTVNFVNSPYPIPQK